MGCRPYCRDCSAEYHRWPFLEGGGGRRRTDSKGLTWAPFPPGDDDDYDHHDDPEDIFPTSSIFTSRKGRGKKSQLDCGLSLTWRDWSGPWSPLSLHRLARVLLDENALCRTVGFKSGRFLLPEWPGRSPRQQEVTFTSKKLFSKLISFFSSSSSSLNNRFLFDDDGCSHSSLFPIFFFKKWFSVPSSPRISSVLHFLSKMLLELEMVTSKESPASSLILLRVLALLSPKIEVVLDKGLPSLRRKAFPFLPSSKMEPVPIVWQAASLNSSSSIRSQDLELLFCKPPFSSCTVSFHWKLSDLKLKEFVFTTSSSLAGPSLAEQVYSPAAALSVMKNIFMEYFNIFKMFLFSHMTCKVQRRSFILNYFLFLILIQYTSGNLLLRS